MNMMKLILLFTALAVTSGTALAGKTTADAKVIPVTGDNYAQANAAFAYEFARLDAVIGWRYMTWDLGETLDELTINGPFLGAIFRF